MRMRLMRLVAKECCTFTCMGDVMSVCKICGGTSDFAINSLISTKRLRPRSQKCSHSVHFCKKCIQAICDASVPQVLVGLIESLGVAYSALTSECCKDSDAVGRK